jgi:hypothetical protein
MHAMGIDPGISHLAYISYSAALIRVHVQGAIGVA